MPVTCSDFHCDSGLAAVFPGAAVNRATLRNIVLLKVHFRSHNRSNEVAIACKRYSKCCDKTMPRRKRPLCVQPFVETHRDAIRTGQEKGRTIPRSVPRALFLRNTPVDLLCAWISNFLLQGIGAAILTFTNTKHRSFDKIIDARDGEGERERENDSRESKRKKAQARRGVPERNEQPR